MSWCSTVVAAADRTAATQAAHAPAEVALLQEQLLVVATSRQHLNSKLAVQLLHNGNKQAADISVRDLAPAR
jgi:hypothetical protein